MNSKFWIIILFFGVLLSALAQTELKIVRQTPHGLLTSLPDGKRILFVSGTPEEMGEAQGKLLSNDIANMYQRIQLVAAGYLYKQNDWFFERIEEVERRSKPFMPERFMREADAMSRGAGVPLRVGRELNLFPEMFHCSGLAVRNSATPDGKVRHVRVLDYMRDIGIQDFALLTVVMPQEGYNWLNLGYAGFIGTVTCMNAEGLTMGEMGGRGEGEWDGLPINFQMREIMEKCRTVNEAIELMQKTAQTCEYYYVISDATGDMAAIYARSGEPIEVTRPGEEHPRLPRAFADTVYVSGPERAKELAKRIEANYGQLDVATLQEIIKRPVAMKSNLQNAIFEPETLEVYWSDAGAKTLACDEKYHQVNLTELLDFHQKYRQNSVNNATRSQ